ncbi:MAG: twin-arginine translocation pathway signal protein, partial [Gemmatimonadaceae bacterium]
MPKLPAIDRALHTGSLSRREVISLLGVAGSAVLTGGSARAASGALLATHHSPVGCVVTPSQTEGPYFVDERLERSDVRVDPTDGTTREGTSLRLRFAVTRVDGNACTPVTGAYVDIWQCDALGVYSDVRDFNGLFDTTGRKFLRGHQVTSKNGSAEFLTIYPGWYNGRAVHIHFKVRVFEGTRRAHEFTSQL